jgi:hypothetical protein
MASAGYPVFAALDGGMGTFIGMGMATTFVMRHILGGA